MKIQAGLLITFFLLILVVSCDRNRVFEKNYSLDNNEWHVIDTKPFKFEIADTSALYNIYLNVRNTTDYRFSNLYLFMTTVFPNDELAKDTLEIVLADNRGQWLGKGRGKYRFFRAPLAYDVRFGLTGNYVFELEQAMRKESLKNISDIGLRIEKTSGN